MQLMVRPEGFDNDNGKTKMRKKSYITISKDYGYHGCIAKSVL